MPKLSREPRDLQSILSAPFEINQQHFIRNIALEKQHYALTIRASHQPVDWFGQHLSERCYQFYVVTEIQKPELWFRRAWKRRSQHRSETSFRKEGDQVSGFKNDGCGGGMGLRLLMREKGGV